MDAIAATCRTNYHATRTSGTRPVSDVRVIVMHDTEGGTAAGVARYFASASAKGSAHLVVDDNACYRTLANTDVPWGAPGCNTDGFHIEQCGYASWTTAQWEQHLNMLHRAAYKAAYHCKLFKIPARFVDRHGLMLGYKGITTHAEVTAWHPAGNEGHHDPGTGWPRALFMSLVQHYLADLNNV